MLANLVEFPIFLEYTALAYALYNCILIWTFWCIVVASFNPLFHKEIPIQATSSLDVRTYLLAYALQV